MNRTTLMALTLMTGSTLALADHGTHWGYSGAEGPAHWGKLDPHFTTCQTGNSQTPIDLANFVDSQKPPIGFHYQPGGEDEVNNGHTIQINYDHGSSITLDGRDYELKQYHFHTPSENHIRGREFPMEAHLVHADRDGHLLVIAVMFNEGDENPALTTPWAAMPDHPDGSAHLDRLASAEELLPKNRDYYRFTGSLTTPPCTEGVTWIVMKEPVSASAAQISRFTQSIGHPNNRPIQPLNARVVTE